MFGRKKSKEVMELEELLNTLQMNLENNYKDLAIKAYKDSEEYLEELNAKGLLKSKAYTGYRVRLDEYKKRMEGYSHRLKINF